MRKKYFRLIEKKILYSHYWIGLILYTVGQKIKKNIQAKIFREIKEINFTKKFVISKMVKNQFFNWKKFKNAISQKKFFLFYLILRVFLPGIFWPAVNFKGMLHYYVCLKMLQTINISGNYFDIP